ncbi:MAG TPA: ArsR family transcriptional regulator [Acidimicrobiia bacterium]|nr:ArsR family transcriptional regulator [Acidimicrobiia bacterium]
MDNDERAAVHAALGDPRRLLIVDELAASDRTVAELAESAALTGNLLAHHLGVLEAAGLIERHVSEGDARRKYVTLQWGRLHSGLRVLERPVRDVAFVCTHNSARSQFAAALWEKSTGLRATSAGSAPAAEVHPGAVRVASEFGVDISGAQPGGYERISGTPDLIVTVCDRAREMGMPRGRGHSHWSVPDPVTSGTIASFRAAFLDIAQRVGRLADATLGAR